MAKDQLPFYLIVDSGAFTAYTKGITIDLKEYIKFCKRCAGDVEVVVNMDQVPGKPGKKRTQEEIEQAASISFRNYERMRDAGLDPLPVFHQTEDISWLYKYLELTDYVGISLIKSGVRGVHMDFLDTMFNDLDHKYAGKKKIKLHGFGITSFAFLKRYPWYSYDSTSWARQSGAGKIFVPRWSKKGGFDYSTTPQMVGMTGVRWRFRRGGDDEKRVGDITREMMERFVEDECGIPVDAVRNMAWARNLAALIYYRNASEYCRKLHADPKLLKAMEQRHYKSFDGKVKFYAAATPSTRVAWFTSVEQHQARHLISYYELAKGTDDLGAKRAALLDYIRRESSAKEHGKSRKWDEKTLKKHKDRTATRMRHLYLPSWLIDIGAPKIRVPLLERIERLVRDAGDEGITNKQLYKRLREYGWDLDTTGSLTYTINRNFVDPVKYGKGKRKLMKCEKLDKHLYRYTWVGPSRVQYDREEEQQRPRA